MGQLWEYVKMALANIRMNRGRSFLTMLIMSVGNGARMEMEQELTAVAGGQIYIYVNSNLEEVPVITEADREAIRMLDGVKGCTSTAGNMLNSVTTGKGTFDAIVNYADPDDEFSNNSVMACGHWYTWDDFYAGNDVAVISEAGMLIWTSMYLILRILTGHSLMILTMSMYFHRIVPARRKSHRR